MEVAVVPTVVARSFEAAGMPAGLQVERLAQSQKARVHIPVPCKRNSSAIVLHPIVALLLEILWRMQVGIHWQPADSNSARPAARPVENSHQTLSPFLQSDFVTNAGGTTSLKRTRFRVRIPVAPADGAIAQR